MESDLPKVLHKLNNRPMVHYVIDAAKKIGSVKIILIIGHKKQLLIDTINDQDIEFAVQSPQLGTGHALLQARGNLEKFEGNVLVLSGDAPLLRAETLTKLIKLHEDKDSSASLLTTRMEDPGGYGRVVRDEQGLVKQIVEEKDADEETRRINEINVGIYVFKARKLFETLPLIKNDNQQGEYYLPDVLKIYVNQGDRPSALLTADVRETHGINTMDHLKNAEKILLNRMVRVAPGPNV